MTTYNNMPANARVWVYQSSRAFDKSETNTINQQIENFINQWQSHGQSLKAYGKVYHNRFIVLIVDESFEAPSGCSIDSSVEMIKAIEKQYKVDLFNRLLFAYQDGEEVKAVPNTDFAALYEQGKLNDTTIVFNNLVKTKAEFEEKWAIPLQESWHARMV